MITFTDPRTYLKGTASVILKDTQTGDINYFSDKFQTGNVSTSTTMGEIRAGLGNAIAAAIPSDSAVNLEFNAADFSLWAKNAQLGGNLHYNAPVIVCQDVEATGESLTIDLTEGTPVAELGYNDVHCYVQEVGKAAPIAAYGAAYALDATTGAISGFTAENGKTYKVWYFVNLASAQIATISTNIDPKVVHATVEMAVYSNNTGAANDGTRIGSLYVVVPRLKLGGNGGVNGDQTNNDTTVISGTALAYDSDVITGCQSACASSANHLAYYLYVPCANATAVTGLVLVGGVVSLPVETTEKAQFYAVMPDGSLVAPDAALMSYELTGAPTGTTVSTAGVITAGSTAGDCEITATYTEGAETFTCTANVSVTEATT